MAAVFGIVRGNQNMQDLWDAHIKTIYYPWTRENLNVCECNRTKAEHDLPICPCKNFTKRKETVALQTSLRPWRLMEIVVPEEAVPQLMADMDIHHDDWEHKSTLKENLLGLRLKAMRAALNAEPLPDIPKDQLPKPMNQTKVGGVVFHPIGWRKDRIEDVPEWGFTQEMV